MRIVWLLSIIISITFTYSGYATEVPIRQYTGKGKGIQLQNGIYSYNNLNSVAEIIKNAKNTIYIQSTTVTNNDIINALVYKSKSCKIMITLDDSAKSDNNLTSLFKSYNIKVKYDSKHKINSNYIIVDRQIVAIHSKYLANQTKNEVVNTIVIYGNNQITSNYINDFNSHNEHSK